MTRKLEEQFDVAVTVAQRPQGAPTGRFVIKAKIWGGITGDRSSFVKQDGKRVVFDSHEAAEAVAVEMRKANDNPHRRATFAYWVWEL
jgi:hypothetical protein